MKILIDQNISHRILNRIKEKFPEVDHVKSFGLECCTDHEIFMFAKNNGFQAILTLDEDFNHLVIVHGIPPKVIWLRGQNSPTPILAELINSNVEKIFFFLFDLELDSLEIWR
jgi:predicted nuclease of predicted toxin-antitoxin system